MVLSTSVLSSISLSNRFSFSLRRFNLFHPFLDQLQPLEPKNAEKPTSQAHRNIFGLKGGKVKERTQERDIEGEHEKEQCAEKHPP